ncbi:long-chain fatty acid--CoA ligase [Camelimonas abortus]|uniref:Long-chain fatty acid--CoA ligase n=1 Tax=Camelimonas abortus TaxID=1017184 RepID=A0ABV7LBK6_9HYPH
MKSTMMSTQLSLNTIFERLDRLFGKQTITSRLPDKSLRVQTYAEIADRTRALAHALQGLGVKPGDRVATLCWNHNAHLEAYFGIPLVGAVMHTLNLRLSGEEIGWIAGHAGSRVLIVDDVLLPLYQQVAKHHAFDHVIVFPFGGGEVPEGLHDYEKLIAPHRGKSFTPAPHDENDAIGLCYTSGTTGRPKGVAYSHRSTVLHSLSMSLPDHCALSSRDRVLAVTPMFHANCWGMPYAAVLTGASLIMPGPHLHGDDLLDLIVATQPTLSLGVPTIWLSLIQFMEANPGRWELPRGMRSLVGGSAAPESLIRAFAERGVTLLQGWGMTETSPLGTVSFIKPELADASDDEKFRRAACAGIPAPLVEIRIVNEEGEECPWDGKTPGELQIRGPYITGSYFRLDHDPDKHTADGWLRTGDVAVFDELGYMRITDRTKDLIKSGGEWISSVDMENALMSHPAVAEAAVIAIPHEKWNERPLACVVFKPGQSATPEELNKVLEGHFARWQLPDRYEVLDAIPRTSTGKFFKLRLREMFPA